MERKPTLVVALGGNALLKRGEPLEAEIQRQNIEQAARTIAGLTEQWRVVLVHGNGPQVGLLALQNSAYDKVTPYPLDVLGAESQGMIGYMLQQALKNNLPQREVSVLLTQVEVDAADPAFSNPTKYIGPVYSEAQAKRWRRRKVGCSGPTAATSAAWCPLRSRSGSSRATPSRRLFSATTW